MHFLKEAFQLTPRKRNYLTMIKQSNSILNLSTSTISNPIAFDLNCKKKLKKSSNISLIESPSISNDIIEMEKDFHRLNLKSQIHSKLDSYSPTPFDPINLDLSYDTIMNKVPWYDGYINDLSLGDENDFNETKSSSFDCEDYPDIAQNKKLTGKIISNALESEKTMRRIFNINPSMIPNQK